MAIGRVNRLWQEDNAEETVVAEKLRLRELRLHLTIVGTSGLQRQTHEERRARARFAFRRQSASVRLGNPATDGESQSCPTGLPRASAVGAIEALKDVV